MKGTPLAIPDVILLEPKYSETIEVSSSKVSTKAKFETAIGRHVVFLQDNQSRSVKKVLCGQHYQLPPKTQGKLVRVVQKVFDVAVDIRKSSPTFGRWVGETLSAESKKQMWIPEGFAHGFVALSDWVEVLYKAVDYYSPEHERCIRWDDSHLAIKWSIESEPILSVKDKQDQVFAAAAYFL